MKKLLSVLLVCTIFFASALTLSACFKTKNKNDSTPTSNTESASAVEQDSASGEPTQSTEPTAPTALAVPVVTIGEDGLAYWEAVENAVRYQYKIGETEMQTAKTSIQLTDGQSIQVKAIGDGENYADSEYSESLVYTYVEPEPEVVIGIPAPAEGRYMRDADVIQDGDTRYVLYTTNATKGEEDNVFAIIKGQKNDDGDWVYGEEKIVLTAGGENAWDEYLGSASIIKGQFEMGDENYSWMLVYQGTDLAAGTANQIGLAVAKEADGTYVRVGTAPVITYDKAYGPNMQGCYAPSAINYDKQSGVRVFYTYADAFGHFSFFWDADLSDLDNIKGECAMGVNAGDLHSGDAALMFPNADMAYDAAANKFYAVKDYSPSAATAPSYAIAIELCAIDEAELYTTDLGYGWVSLGYWDYTDLLGLVSEYERSYSACIVTDAYGHVLDTTEFEIVYNTCKSKAAAGEDYVFTQKFETYTATTAKD